MFIGSARSAVNLFTRAWNITTSTATMQWSHRQQMKEPSKNFILSMASLGRPDLRVDRWQDQEGVLPRTTGGAKRQNNTNKLLGVATDVKPEKKVTRIRDLPTDLARDK